MTLNLTQLKDLEYICQMAELADQLLQAKQGQQPFFDSGWLERISIYRQIFQREIKRLEHTAAPTCEFGLSLEERGELERRAKAYGMTLSQYLAELVKYGLSTYDL